MTKCSGWKAAAIISGGQLRAITQYTVVPGGGGGGVLIIFLGGVCRPVQKTLTLFQTKKYDFPYPISDLTLKMYILFQTLWCVTISVTLNRFTAYGTSWRPKRCSWFFEFAINVHGNTRYSKSGIPDQTDGIYTLFQTKMAKSIPYFRLEMLENDTLWGGTYLYGLYMGVTPPPPPPRDCSSGNPHLHLTYEFVGLREVQFGFDWAVTRLKHVKQGGHVIVQNIALNFAICSPSSWGLAARKPASTDLHSSSPSLLTVETEPGLLGMENQVLRRKWPWRVTSRATNWKEHR